MKNFLGIDLSSQPKRTAACVLQLNSQNKFKILDTKIECDNDKLIGLMKQANFIGIDAPFGWPIAFQNAVATWNSCAWDDSMAWEQEFQEQLRLRKTDIYLKKLGIGVMPLSVSTDKIALPAMRAMLLLKKFGVTDKTGTTPFGNKHFYEVYPAATLARWKIDRTNYKKPDAIEMREKIVTQIESRFRFSNSEEHLNDCTRTDHRLDALICALTAFKASIKQTDWPPPSELDSSIIEQEGWIHLPVPQNE